MSLAFVLLILVIVFVVIFATLGFRIVSQSETMVIERLGRYHCTLSSGINIIWPILDKPRTIDWKYATVDTKGNTIIRREIRNRIDLRETVYDYPEQNVITRDNVAIRISAILYFQISDPKRTIYEIANLPDAIEKLTQTTLRNVIGELDLDHTLTSRDTINSKLRVILDEATDKWGVKVNRVEIQDIIPPDDIKLAMEKQMRAERDRRAVVLEAEGKKQAKILDAEGIREYEIYVADGQQQAAILKATGEAEAQVKIAEAQSRSINLLATATAATGKSDPSSIMVTLKYIEAFSQLTSGQNNKVVVLPYESSALLGSLSSIREILSQSVG